MPGYRLLRHHNYAATAEPLPDAVRRKAVWSQVLLGTRGRTPNVKSTTGYNARWRRTPVQGFHYYLWWIPLSESELADAPPETPATPATRSWSTASATTTRLTPHRAARLDEFEEVQIEQPRPPL